MIVEGEIRTGMYFDSVTLMLAARDLNTATGVLDAAVVMGTKENKSILKSAGLWLDAFDGAGETDLLLAVRANDAAIAAAALRTGAERLNQRRAASGAAEDRRPVSLAGAIETLPGANFALISVAGRYAADLAMQALDAGLHVMLFSDNVPLAREIELKQLAQAKGLLMMGPDCGTAILNGVPLAFANVVARGDIGIVAAAGTGLQEISSIVSNRGAGISQAIGTGGRDVKREVGGIMFLEGIRALREDPLTRVMVLVSKPPHESVLRRIGQAAAEIEKPIVTAFLGIDPNIVTELGMTPAATLEEAALMAAALSAGQKAEAATAALRARDCAIEQEAIECAAQAGPGQKYIRGLYSGGTFCAEAQILCRELNIAGVYSNVPIPGSCPLEDPWKSRGHALIDLGDDAFTVGRPHPMIDYSLRNRRILEEANAAETALILLDVVLGYGSNPNPVGELSPAIREAIRTADRAGRRLTIACSVTGTPQDPQDQPKVAAGLQSAGARVFPSNAAVSRFAAHVAHTLGGR